MLLRTSPIVTMVSVALAFQITIAAQAGYCYPMTYSSPTKDTPGKFTGEIPLEKLGPVLLPDGTAQFLGDELNIKAVPEWLFDADVVAKGAIVRAEIVPQTNWSVVAGLVYFFDGQWVKNLGSPRIVDAIETLSGEHIRGRITARVGEGFSVNPEMGGPARKVNFADIKSITSPRAFNFNIVVPTAKLQTADTFAFEATKVEMAQNSVSRRTSSPKRATVPTSELAGTNPGISKRAIATFVAIDVFMDIVPAVAIPLTLQKATQRGALDQIRKTDILNIENNQ